MIGETDVLKARWMTGGSCAGLGPSEWQDFDDLSRLVLTGQFTRIATRPTTAATLSTRPDIPSLPVPPLPEDLRPLFRRILDAKPAPASQVVRLIAARGYCVNPTDWMPTRSEANLPPLYEPWRDWLDGNLPGDDAQILNPETWSDLAPSQRYVRLTQLHAENADAARALITEIAPTLAAEQRLRMLQCLRAKLTNADADLLSTFKTDRSSKVQTLVKTQLARLGEGPETDDEALAELTDYVDVAKAGILSRKQVVTSRKLKTQAQRKRRAQVFAKISLFALSETLGLTPDDVIETWDFGQATDDFLTLVAASGTDAQVHRTVERAFEQKIFTPAPLMERLDGETRTAFGKKLIAGDEMYLARSRAWISEPNGTVGWDTISGFDRASLIKRATLAAKPADEAQAIAALAFLGLIAGRDAATLFLNELTTAGVLAVDPRLTLLRLNAAL